MTEIARLLSDAERLMRTLNEAYYRNYSGQAAALELTAIYQQQERLFSRESFTIVAEALEHASDPLTRASLHNLKAFLCLEYLDAAGGAERESVIADSLQSTISLEEESLSLRQAQGRIGTLNDRAARNGLDRQMTGVVDSFDSRLIGSFQRTLEGAGELGASGYLPLLTELHGWDLELAEQQATQFLDQTEAAFNDVLTWYLKRICGIDRSEAGFPDVLYLFRAPWLRSEFQPFNLLNKAQTCLGEMGLVLSDGVVLDLETREGKVARAFCSPVSVPDRIYLSLLPRGGYEDYCAFYHELGHALHFSNINPKLPFGARYLGDDSLTEGYAMLLEYLVHKPHWLRRYLSFKPEPDDVRFFELHRLYLVRRYCGKLLFELELYRSGVHAAMRDEYVNLLSGATGVQINPSYYLLDIDPHLYCLTYLRAWSLESLLSAYLHERWDEQWWRDGQSGEFLRALWSRGQTLTADELATELGGADLNLSRLADGFVKSLGR